MTKVINLLGGPSAGKSTNALALSAYLKQKRFNVEYAHEFAKDLCWDDRHATLDDQLYIFAKQQHRLYFLKDKVDYIVTDSPLFLSLYYLTENQKKYTWRRTNWESQFTHLVLSTFNQYQNYNFFVNRGDRKFIQEGRYHNEEQSREIDTKIRTLLHDYDIFYQEVGGVEDLKKYLNV